MREFVSLRVCLARNSLRAPGPTICECSGLSVTLSGGGGVVSTGSSLVRKSFTPLGAEPYIDPMRMSDPLIPHMCLHM